MSRSAIWTDRQLQRLLPPQCPAPASPVPGPTRAQGRPGARSPVKIAPATPELLEAQRRQRGYISSLSYKSRTENKKPIETKQKTKEKKRLMEMERSMTDMRNTLSREGRTVSRFTFQPEPEEVMIPPTPPPLLPLTPLQKPPPLTDPRTLSEPPSLLPVTRPPKPPSQRNPTHNFFQVRSKANLT